MRSHPHSSPAADHLATVRMSIVDFHNHVMPCVDDGASSDEQTDEALRAFLAQDVTAIVATPHVNASITLNAAAFAHRMAELDQGWERLSAIAGRVSGIEIHRGAEIMLDTPGPDLSDPRLRIAGRDFALCEFPYMSVPPNSTGVIHHLRRAGVTPVIAHPERYAGVDTSCAHAVQWRNAGALLQINAGSLTGRYGEHARRHAYALLERGLADFLCSDYHSRGKPATTAAHRLLSDLGGAEQFQLMTSVNPRRLLDGEAPVPVPPLALRLGFRERLRRWFR